MRDGPTRSKGQARSEDAALSGVAATRVAVRQGIKAGSSWESIAQRILDSSEQWLAAQCRGVHQPTLVVNLGFQQEADRLKGHRLQDYAVVIADRIKDLCGVQFSGVRLSKQQRDSTTVAVTEMWPGDRPTASAPINMLTRRSYATPAYAEEVRDCTAPLSDILVPSAALGIHVSYVTGLPRTWSRLWEPTMAGIFANRSPKGGADSAQVVHMGLEHMSVGDELGHRIRLTISGRRISAT